MGRTGESKIVHEMIQYLRGLNRIGPLRVEVIKMHGSPYMPAGEPDILACVNGRMVRIEAKKPGEKPTPNQMASMRRWQKVGALVGWCTSVEQVKELLEHLDEREWLNPQLEREAK